MGPAAPRPRRRIAPEDRSLAVEGGPRAVPHALPWRGYGADAIGAAERENVLAVLRSRRLHRHEQAHEDSYCGRLETAFESYLGVAHAYATVSGSSAIQTALHALGVGPGDEVVVPAVTWVTAVNAVIAVGAVPVAAAVDTTLTLDPVDAERCVTPRTRALLVAHLNGFPADMEALGELARRHDLAVVEDVAQAPGGRFRGARLGSLGDAGCFSFNFSKLMAAGEGGLLASPRDDVYELAVSYLDGTVYPRRKAHLQPRVVPATAARMNELTAAVAYAQFGRLERMLATLRPLRDRLLAELAGCEILRPVRAADPDGEAGYVVALDLGGPERAERFAEALRAEGVPMVVTAASGLLAGAAEYRHLAQTLATHPGHGPRGAAAPLWPAFVGREGLHPLANPWRHPAWTGRPQPLEELLPRLAPVGRMAWLRLHPRLAERHVRWIGTAVRKVDRALAVRASPPLRPAAPQAGPYSATSKR